MDRGGRELPSLNELVGSWLHRLTAVQAFARSGRRESASRDGDSVRRNGRSRWKAFRRFLEQAPQPRSGIGSTLALAFIASGWFYGAVVAGSAPSVITGAASTVGLKTTDIVLTGQVETTEQQIFDALGLNSTRSLFGFDAGDARERILALPWVKDVAIRKLYPGKLTVALAEKRAVAVWQHNDRLTVVEQSGKPITRFGIADLISNRFAYLPHLVGQGAPEAASQILPLVARHPLIAGQVASYVRVADRRWDLELANGMRVKLPEYQAEARLEALAKMAGEDRLLEREISVVDMRLADRVTLRLLPAAAKTRHELVAARLKAMKKADRKL